MSSISIQIERWQGTDMAFVRSRVGDAPETDETYKDVLRSIDHDVLRGTCVPVEYQPHAGALVALLFDYSRWTVLSVEIRWFEGVGVWVAEAVGEDNDEMSLRRGTGLTPVDALVALAFDIQYE